MHRSQPMRSFPGPRASAWTISLFRAKARPLMMRRPADRCRKAEQREALLNRELSHRVKNSLAVIQALAHHTLRSTPDPQIFAEAFQGRLQALASAHEMLTQSNWAGADFGALVRQQPAPFTSDDGSGLQLDGPSVLLHPETATSLALVLHELATNASKVRRIVLANGINLTVMARDRGTASITAINIGP